MPRSPVQNLKRRGAVYWWRRTISLVHFALSTKNSISLEFSLNTKELDTARGRAAALTAYSERLRMSFRDNVAHNGLDEQTLANVFVDELRSYRNELVHLDAAWKAQPVWRNVSRRDDDLQVFETFWSALAEEGVGAPRDWNFVEKHFAALDREKQQWLHSLLRDLADLPTALRKDAANRLEQLAVTPTALNTEVAVDVVARARAEAARRVRVGEEFTKLASHGSLASIYAARHTHGDQYRASPSPEQSPLALVDANMTQGQQDLLRMTPTQYVELFLIDRFGQLAHREGSKRAQRTVGESTYRDLRWAASLLEKTLPVGTPLSAVRDEHLVTLDTWFDRLPTSIGKSPRHHEAGTTLNDIAAEAEAKVEDGSLSAGDIGLTDNTTNKHWHNLLRVHRHLREKLPHLPAPDFSRFIVPDNRAAKEAREKYTVEQGKAIFHLPPWTGCAGLKDRLSPGTQVIHDALFFVLLLVWYTGARREEICKLQVADVFPDAATPHLYIRGQVKTIHSRRKVPLHSELIRLGLLAYVRTMAAEGETSLFPELYPAEGTKRAMGDVFYKVWWLYIRPLVPDLKRGQAMHAARHSVSDALKQAGVDLEKRNDILGQSQKGLGEGAERYSEPLALATMKEMVEHVPIVTEHLPDSNIISLLPPHMRAARPARAR